MLENRRGDFFDSHCKVGLQQLEVNGSLIFALDSTDCSCYNGHMARMEG